MVIKVTGKNIEITEGMKNYIESKMKYLDKFIPDSEIAKVTVSKRKNVIKVEVFYTYNKKDIKTKIEGEEFYSIIDETIDILKNKMSKLHEKITEKSHDSIKDSYKKEQIKEEKELLDAEEDE